MSEERPKYCEKCGAPEVWCTCLDHSEPDVENMPIEQVNQYLRDHGYDPEQVAMRGKLLAKALIEDIHLRDRTDAAERDELKTENAALSENLVNFSETLKNYGRELAELRERKNRKYFADVLSGIPIIVSESIPDGKIFMSQQLWDRIMKTTPPETPDADYD